MEDPSNFIDSLIKALQSIPTLMEVLVKALQTPYGWILLAGILIWFAVNKDLFVFLRIREEKQNKRLEYLEKYLVNDHISETSTKKIVSDFRNSFYFKLATGIQAEEKMRLSLIKLHEGTSADISWLTLKRALPFYEFSHKNELNIRKISKIEKLGRIYNSSVGWLFLGFTAAIFIIMITLFSKNFLLSISFMILDLVLLLFSLFAFSQNLPIKSALKIKNELEKRVVSKSRP